MNFIGFSLFFSVNESRQRVEEFLMHQQFLICNIIDSINYRAMGMPWLPVQHRPQFASYPPQRSPPFNVNQFAPYPTPHSSSSDEYQQYADSPVHRRRNRARQTAAAPASPSILGSMSPYLRQQHQQRRASPPPPRSPTPTPSTGSDTVDYS